MVIQALLGSNLLLSMVLDFTLQKSRVLLKRVFTSKDTGELTTLTGFSSLEELVSTELVAVFLLELISLEDLTCHSEMPSTNITTISQCRQLTQEIQTLNTSSRTTAEDKSLCDNANNN
jgi:hypothetical protein